MSLIDVVHKNKLRNKAISNIKTQQILCSTGLNIVGIFLLDGPFDSDIGILNIHPSKGIHWVFDKNEKDFDSFGLSTSK